MFDLEQLNAIRSAEIARIVRHFRPGARVLEIGAGTGQQALALTHHGFAVEAIDLATSGYRGARVYPVTDYDGSRIPFPDAAFDIVFSSNVLEHVADLTTLNKEIRRVLKPGGYCVHAMPTHVWRFWTTLLLLPATMQQMWSARGEILPRRPWSGAEWVRLRRAWYDVAKHAAPVRHGERGNIVSELWLFHPRWWRRTFLADGFEIVGDESMGLFYTGTMLLGPHLSMARREQLARLLGSSCHLFELRPGGRASP
jgi:SAM-dependent methyltransferase